jgi:hypothetical protein
LNPFHRPTGQKGAAAMMRLKRRAEPPPPPPQEAPAVHSRSKPPWQDLLDPVERPNREDLAAQHNVFTDTLLEPVPLPRWLRGSGRPNRDKLS